MKGVRFSKYHNRWEARVTTGKRELLGRFRMKEMAEECMGAYLRAGELPYNKPLGQFVATTDKKRFTARLGEWIGRELIRIKRR